MPCVHFTADADADAAATVTVNRICRLAWLHASSSRHQSQERDRRDKGHGMEPLD